MAHVLTRGNVDHRAQGLNRGRHLLVAARIRSSRTARPAPRPSRGGNAARRIRLHPIRANRHTSAGVSASSFHPRDVSRSSLYTAIASAKLLVRRRHGPRASCSTGTLNIWRHSLHWEIRCERLLGSNGKIGIKNNVNHDRLMRPIRRASSIPQLGHLARTAGACSGVLIVRQPTRKINPRHL